MDTSNEENDDFTFYSEVRSSRRASKEKLLDDSFRKAEKSKGIQNDDFQELIKNISTISRFFNLAFMSKTFQDKSRANTD